MKPPRFIYHDPATVEEALGLLALHGDAASILAGGQSLMPMLDFRLARPDHVIDINRLAALATVIPGPDAGLRIGALVRQRTLERSELIRERCPMITQAMPFVGRPQIRIYLPEQVIGEAGLASRHGERRHAGCPSRTGSSRHRPRRAGRTRRARLDPLRAVPATRGGAGPADGDGAGCPGEW